MSKLTDELLQDLHFQGIGTVSQTYHEDVVPLTAVELREGRGGLSYAFPTHSFDYVPYRQPSDKCKFLNFPTFMQRLVKPPPKYTYQRLMHQRFVAECFKL